MLMASPQVTQEIGVRGLRVDEWAGGNDGRKTPSVTAVEAGTQGRHGAWQEQGEKNGRRWDWEGQNPREWEGNFGSTRPPEWSLVPTSG